ncbi:hypothetical protein H5410_039677, partial [Solanum commersonii]
RRAEVALDHRLLDRHHDEKLLWLLSSTWGCRSKTKKHNIYIIFKDEIDELDLSQRQNGPKWNKESSGFPGEWLRLMIVEETIRFWGSG